MATPVPHHTATPRPTSTPTPRPTPTPVFNMQIGATPLPVVIKSEPDVIWTYWVPGIGIVISALAALFAGLALRRIGQQIKIANDQIGLAKQQITLANEQIIIANNQTRIADDSLKATQQSVELAQKDFEATMKSLAINEEQAKLSDAERGRKPDLRLMIDHHQESFTMRAGFHDFDLAVFNAGDKTAKGAVVHILWPSEGVEDRLERMDPLLRMTEELKIRADRSRVALDNPYNLEGKPVHYITRQITHDIVLKNSVSFARLDVYIEPGEYRVGWRIIAEDGTCFPPEKGLNFITVTVT